MAEMWWVAAQLLSSAVKLALQSCSASWVLVVDAGCFATKMPSDGFRCSSPKLEPIAIPEL